MARWICIIHVVLLWSSLTQEATSNPLMTASKAISLADQILDAAFKFKVLMDSEESLNDAKNEREITVLTTLESMDEHISELHDETKSLENKYELDTIDDKMKEIFQIVDYVEDMYHQFVQNTESKSCIKQEQLNRLFKHKKYDYSFKNLDELITTMYEFFIDPETGSKCSLLNSTSENKNYEFMCNTQQSTQQTLIHVYNAIVSTDLKAIALKLVADQTLAKDKKNATEKVLNPFKARIEQLYENATAFIVPASRYVWRCDPSTPVEGTTYLKLQEVFQGIIAYEEDNEKNTCGKSECHELYDLENMKEGKAKMVLYEANSDYARSDPVHKKQCDGHITDCKEMPKKVEFCLAGDNDYHRFIGIRGSENEVYGQDYQADKCPNPGQIERYHAFLNLCKFCLCTCASKSRLLDRYFSLENVESLHQSHWVVTGVQIKIKNHVFHIAIQEGKLGKNGTIIQGSQRWRDRTKVGGYNFEEIAKLNAHHSKESSDFPVNDYVYSVNWEQKTVYLDDVINDSADKVVVGVRFKQQGDALKLQVLLATFDFAAGGIKQVDSNWIPDNNEAKNRYRIVLSNADDPIKLMAMDPSSKHELNSPGKYLEFAVTDVNKDIGSSTIPYIDSQEVISNPPVPLCGIGLYHKGMENDKSGGFLGLKLIQCNFADRTH